MASEQYTEGEGRQPAHTHRTVTHSHHHCHVTHHHKDGVGDDVEHRVYWHPHAHNHNALTHSREYSADEEEREHAKRAHPPRPRGTHPVARLGGPMDRQRVQEERTARQIRVRQVTHVQASWTEGERGTPGSFTLQLILDNGAAAYVLRPTAADLTALEALFGRAACATFGLERQVLMFSDRALGDRGG